MFATCGYAVWPASPTIPAYQTISKEELRPYLVLPEPASVL
jgi:hypothetical protein